MSGIHCSGKSQGRETAGVLNDKLSNLCLAPVIQIMQFRSRPAAYRPNAPQSQHGSAAAIPLTYTTTFASRDKSS